MKQSDESYLDSLLKNISVDDDNSFETMLNDDANSFGMDNIETEDLALDAAMQDENTKSSDIKPDFADMGDLGSWDDFDSMGHPESFPKELLPDDFTSSLESPEQKKNQDSYIEQEEFQGSEGGSTPKEEITENLLDEIQNENMQEAEDKSQFEENLMEELLSDEDTSAYSSEDEAEPVPEEAFSQSGEEEDLFGKDEVEADMGNDESNPLGDVEDLLGMLNNEPDSGSDGSDDLFGSLGLTGQADDNNDEDDIFSLDDILGADESEAGPDIPADTVKEEGLISDTVKDELFESDEAEKAAVPEKKPGFFARIFGNIHDEKSKKANKKPGVPLDENGNPIKKPKKSDADIKAEKAEKKKAQEEKKKAQAAKKAEAKALKEAKKKEKEEAKKAKLVEEVEIDEGRINPVGASIVFVFLGIITAAVVLGTNSFSYSQSVKNATVYFGKQKYNNAYSEVRGVKIKQKDLEIYDKIMTVMFVNKQLNSYNNYYNMDKYPEALDSLLKGLERYDEYISLAKELGIKSDLDYVRNQIVGELNSIFHLSEEDAYRIISNEDQGLYSQEVIEAASVN